MSRKFVAFDIETTKEVPGEDFDWESHRPLGISCAALLKSDETTPVFIHGKGVDGRPAKQLSREEAGDLVNHLSRLVEQQFTILTWNGLGFDFDILAEESGMVEECRNIANGHVDMMFHVFCDRGFPVALDKVAQGMGIPGKPAGMSGYMAPRMWADGRFDDVLAYVGQDVRITLQIAQSCTAKRRMLWITRKGSASSMELKRGWLSVEESLKIPPPDTSWMSQPISRDRFTRWMAKREGASSR
jgi:hypothetical protein